MLALIGLDSVDVELVDELVAEGRMPVLADLRSRGTTIPLTTPGAFFTASAYPSLWTGEDVGEHGLYYPFLWAAEEQRVVVGTSVPSPPAFWEPIAEAGGRVLVIDPYEGRRPASDVGTCLSGVQFENRVVLERWSSPHDALRRWERRVGRGGPAQEVFGQQSARRLTALRRSLLDAPPRVARLVELAMVEETPDLLVVMLPTVHLAGHQLWDPVAVLPKGTAPPELQTGLRDVYAATDAALGRMLAALPDQADVILFSVLGMTFNTSRVDMLPAMLDAVLSGKPASEQPQASSSSVWRMRAKMPTGLRAAVASALPNRLALELAVRAELRGQDWSSTRAFCVPSDAQGLIRVNLRGREREGIVSPAERDALCEEIAAGLLTFEDDDGGRVVERVLRTDAVVPNGSAGATLPDLIVDWRTVPAVGRRVVRSPRHGVVAAIGPGSGRSGNHMPHAWATVVPSTGAVGPSPGVRHDVTDLSRSALGAFGLLEGSERLLVRRAP